MARAGNFIVVVDTLVYRLYIVEIRPSPWPWVVSGGVWGPAGWRKCAMSQYANYTFTSEEYDTTRVAVGVDTILGCLARCGVPLGEQAVLEAGCGTGNYLQALHPHLGSLVGVDLNEGMLAQARAKLPAGVKLTCGSILRLPYEDGRFDAVLCNQVIHHLEEGPGAADDPTTWEPSDFANVTRFVLEAYRVLHCGGALVINAMTHIQSLHGYWWAELIPTAVQRVRCRLPDIEPLRRILTGAGFEIETVAADLDGILQGPSYLDPKGPLSEAWRAGDSTWTLTSEEELACARRRVEQMNLEGTMQAYLDKRESMRLKVGQSTFICGRKPAGG